MMVLHVKKKGLIHLVFRIITSGLVKLVQNIVAACTPGGKIHPAVDTWILLSRKTACHSSLIAQVGQTVFLKIQFTLLLSQADIYIQFTTCGCNNGISNLLIRAFYYNLAKLIALS